MGGGGGGSGGGVCGVQGSAHHARENSAQHAMVCGERTACDVLGQVLELGRAEQDPVLFPPAEPRWQVVEGGERW